MIRKKCVSPLILGTAFMLSLAACQSQPAKDRPTDENASVTVAGDPLSREMNNALQVYYSLREAMVDADTARANKAADSLQTAVTALPLTNLESDSGRYEAANAAVKSIGGEVAGLQGEKDMAGKRTEFQLISDIMYDLIKAVRPQGATVYREFCPMAFEGKGGYWLSNSEKIRNPYYGHQMLTCGEVKETLTY